MSCPAFEELIARHVGGDLAPEEACAVEQHLRACPDCADLARSLEQDRAWLASRPPEVLEVDYAAIRREIRRKVERPRRSWKWLVPAAVAAAIVFALATDLPRPRIAPPPEPPAPVVAEAAPTPAPIAPPKPVRASRRPQLTLEAAMRMLDELNPPAAPTGSDSPVEMRIQTRDPNVTIILLQESKGDSQ